MVLFLGDCWECWVLKRVCGKLFCRFFVCVWSCSDICCCWCLCKWCCWCCWFCCVVIWDRGWCCLKWDCWRLSWVCVEFLSFCCLLLCGLFCFIVWELLCGWWSWVLFWCRFYVGFVCWVVGCWCREWSCLGFWRFSFFCLLVDVWLRCWCVFLGFWVCGWWVCDEFMGRWVICIGGSVCFLEDVFCFFWFGFWMCLLCGWICFCLSLELYFLIVSGWFGENLWMNFSLLWWGVVVNVSVF